MKKITAKALAQAAGGVLAHEGNEPVAEQPGFQKNGRK